MADEHGRDATASELTASLAALGQFVVSEQSLHESLQRVAELSVRVVYGADGAGVTWVVTGKPSTVTVAGDFVRRIDEIQYALDEGPCLQAFRTQQLVLIESLELEKRWPRFTAAALGHGLRGVVAVPLTAHGAQLGALNIYALQAWAFDEASAGTAALFGEQAAIVLANAEAFTRARTAAVNLREALTSRAVIDMAKGIVMAQRGCDPDEAFDHLRQLSQTQHRKLRDASDLVDEMSCGSREASSQPASELD
ncbi:GAF and ANTAR domain-containing protein [Nocardioides sp. InS609-2]|uniref:GAF and ANTAR domain-containing protein n=1 Tax=Nocardioides sp. InS609-2 TaxID=2760705 RepID=UPI0020BD487A|nr:GAF and ANTAR domain-containing protein [Nocardioides sp. InS609-2]